MAGFMVKEYAPIYHSLTAHAEMQGGIFVGMDAAAGMTKEAAVTEPAYFHVLELLGDPILVPDDRTMTLKANKPGKFKRVVPGEVARAHVTQEVFDALNVGDKVNCLLQAAAAADVDQFIVSRKMTWADMPAVELLSVAVPAQA